MRIVAAISLLFVVLIGGQARARLEPEQLAHAHYTLGQQAYEEGRWSDALREFREAYQLSPRSALHSNMALCHEKLGDFEAAVRALERYLGEDEKVNDRVAVEKKIDELRAKAKERARLAPVVTPSEAPAATQAKTSAPPPKKKSRQWVWGVAVGGVLVVGMALGLGLGLTLSGDSGPALLPATKLE